MTRLCEKIQRGTRVQRRGVLIVELYVSVCSHCRLGLSPMSNAVHHSLTVGE